MITGDNILTACSVAQQLRILTKTPLICSILQGTSYSFHLVSYFSPDEVWWISPDEAHKHPMTDEVSSLLANYDLCLSGVGT